MNLVEIVDSLIIDLNSLMGSNSEFYLVTWNDGEKCPQIKVDGKLTVLSKYRSVFKFKKFKGCRVLHYSVMKYYVDRLKYISLRVKNNRDIHLTVAPKVNSGDFYEICHRHELPNYLFSISFPKSQPRILILFYRIFNKRLRGFLDRCYGKSKLF